MSRFSLRNERIRKNECCCHAFDRTWHFEDSGGCCSVVVVMRNTCIGTILRRQGTFSRAWPRGVLSVAKSDGQVIQLAGFFPSRSFSVENNRHEFSPARQSDSNEVGVFWDLENCPVPTGVDPFVVKPNIELALRKSGYQGPIFVNGYGNIQLTARAHVLEALSETGIDIHHVPNGGKNSSDRALLVDMLLWANKCLPPAHVFLISGDGDFSLLLHKLRMLNFSVLLAIPHKGASSALTSAADKMWIWQDIVRGEGLVGQTLLHGLVGSPGKGCSSSALIKDKDVLLPENISDMSERHGGKLEFVKDVSQICPPLNTSKSQEVPRIVLDRIFDVIRGRPGISLGDLSKELRDANIQTNCYEYKNLCAFMLSIKGIEIRRVNASSWRDRYRLYLASVDINRGMEEMNYSVQQKEIRGQSALASLTESAGDEVPTERQEMDKDKLIKLEKNNSFKWEEIPEQVPGGQHQETAYQGSHTNVQKGVEDESMNSEKKLSWSARLLRMFTKARFTKSR